MATFRCNRKDDQHERCSSTLEAEEARREGGRASVPDYQRAACELASIGWQLMLDAQSRFDSERELRARSLVDRAVDMCWDMGAVPCSPTDYLQCAYKRRNLLDDSAGK